MELKIQHNGVVYAIMIGYKTAWFESAYFITVAKEWYEKREVIHAELIFHS